ncbi:MAG: hypothetical protein FWG90_04790 [Oscillospiraceae bacterium]|nr:hypothetical protein [Oscillospiraceae bacterium]
MQSIFFPLPLKTHIIFAAVSILFFAVCFYRKRMFYYIFIIMAIGSTFLIYLCDKLYKVNYVGILELFLLAIVLFLMSYEKKYPPYIKEKRIAGEHYK